MNREKKPYLQSRSGETDMSESRKYKIVFLDDEISTLTYLQYAVDWESLGITVCGTAQDGEKGLELIRKVNPDIVITDIRMPKYSGLDVLNVMREEQRNCRVVMLSAYADFEYARDALKMNAADYLLKPVDEKKLAELIKALTEKIDMENEREGSHYSEEKEKQLRKILLSEQEDNPEETFSRMLTDCDCFVSCVISDENYLSNVDLTYEQIKNIIKKALPKAILIIVKNREICGVINWEDYGENELTIQFELERLGIKIVMGVTRLSGKHIKEAFIQARLARYQCFYSDKKLEWYETDMVFSKNMKTDVNIYQGHIEEYCIRKDWTGLETYCMDVLQSEYERKLIPNQLARLAFDLLVCVKLIITKLYPEKTMIILRHIGPEYFEGCNVRQIFESKVSSLVGSIAEKMSMETEEQKSLAIVRKAMEYTALHYKDPSLSLQDVADFAGVSRNYFSTVFKEYKDKKYWDYLSEYRIEEAKKLLKETVKTNYEIALDIGYKSEYHSAENSK